MSTRPAIIALLLTLLLAVGAYFVLRPSGGGTPGPRAAIEQGDPLFSARFDAAAINAVTLLVPPGGAQAMERSQGADNRWYWRASAGSARKYQIDDTRIRSFLRMLSEAKGIATPQSGRPLPDSPPPVVLTLHGAGGDTVLRLSPRALGGQVLADVTTPDASARRPAIVQDELLAVLTSPGPSAWRDTRALGTDPGSAARITFTDGAGKSGFSLARLDGQWFVSTPNAQRGATPDHPVISAPAEGEPVATVLATLANLNIARFYDEQTQPTPQAAGLDNPSAILTLEFDERAIDPASQRPVTTTRTVELRFGQAADTEGTSLFASPDGGATIFAVSAVQLAKLTAPMTNLVMKASTRTLPSDVGAVEITAASPSTRSLKLSRDTLAGRWFESLDGAPAITQDTATAAGSEAILNFFTRAGAEAVTIGLPGGSESGAKAVARVTLRSASDQPLDRFDLFTMGNALVVRSGSICRTYPNPPEELLRWLATLSR